MRAALLLAFIAPLLANCGSKGDLFIGELPRAIAGSPPSSSGATSGSAGTAGSSSEAGTGGSAGAVSEAGAAPVAGSSGEGGTAGEGGTEMSAGGESCADLVETPLTALIHRYGFEGTGTKVTDSVGGQDGTVVGGTLLDGSGVLALPGNDKSPDQYVNLPNTLISPLSAVTIVVWTTWQGGAGYQRIFDFGISDAGEVQGGSGKSYIAVMPSNGFANGTGLGAEIAAPGFATQQLPSSEDIQDRYSQVALAFTSGVSIELFLNGKSLIKSPTTLKLSNIVDKNNWVGESQWTKDHPYHGTFDEVRIYNQALNECQLRTMLERGPDAL